MKNELIDREKGGLEALYRIDPVPIHDVNLLLRIICICDSPRGGW